MELMVDVKVRPKIVPIVNDIYSIVGIHHTSEELDRCAKKFMSINHDRFTCDTIRLMDFKRKAQLLVTKSFKRGTVDIITARFSFFKYKWLNHELHLVFRILFDIVQDNLVVQKDQLQSYILEWMQVEGAYIGLDENEYWGENGVSCSFRVEINESDVDLIAFTSEE